MKKTASQRPKTSPKRVAAPARSRITRGRDELRPHYDFDYSKSKPNRFAARFSGDTVVVVLDPDVANVFQSAESVNAFLRSAISARQSFKDFLSQMPNVGEDEDFVIASGRGRAG